MTQSGHDQLAWRLAAILTRLNQGERLDLDALAEEFKVSKRTIQRDILERFAFLPWEKVDGRYALDPAYLGRITVNDIARFASLAGLSGLFPNLDTQFIRELFDSRLEDTLQIHGGSFENLRERAGDFRLLQQAIGQHRMVRFTYQKPEGEKRLEAAPYRLVNHTGVWYLVALDKDQAKAYAFGRIAALSLLDESYVPDSRVVEMLARDDSIWINERKTEVILSVAPAAAPYFRRRKLISQQVIEKELENGGLIVSGKFAHPNQILPIVRYWIPHVRIISPEGWQADMAQGLQSYLDA